MYFAKNIKTILLDVDGTLIDSNHQHAMAWQRTFEEFGFKIPYADIRSKIGMGGDQLLPALTGIEIESNDGKKIAEFRSRIFRSEFLPTIHAFPGTRDLLLWFKKNGYRLTIATSASRDDLNGLLGQCSLQELMDRETTSSDAENSKPDPDIVLAALKKSQTAPTDAVMLGDTPFDIEAASAAKVKIIAFTCGGWDEFALQKAEKIFSGPAELLDKLRAPGGGVPDRSIPG